MIRGTTPTHTFNIPFYASDIEVVKIIYSQNDNILFTKNTEDCLRTAKSIVVKLEQEDTYLFDHNYPVQIQLRVKLTNGDVRSTNVIYVPVGKCLDDEVLV